MQDYPITGPPLAFIGDENARLRSRLPLTEWSSAMGAPNRDGLSHKRMAFVSRPSAAPQANEYRVYLMGHDGHIRSSRAFVCGDDADAIVWAEQMADGHDIELWSGERFVRRVNAMDKPGAVSLEVIDGRIVPKE